MLMRAGILVGGMIAVAVGVMVVAVRMLMRGGILVGGMVGVAVRAVVVTVGIVSFSKERCLFVAKVE